MEILHGFGNDEQSSERIRALRTFFRLIHVNMDCALYTGDKRLPAWASHQNEVTCIQYAKKNEHTTFFIESSQDSRCKSSVGDGCWKGSYDIHLLNPLFSHGRKSHSRICKTIVLEKLCRFELKNVHVKRGPYSKP